MLRANQQFDEVHVVDGVAERTGNSVDRSAVRGRATVTRSVSDLARKFRTHGDGYYYMAAGGWPAETTRIELTSTWTPMS